MTPKLFALLLGGAALSYAVVTSGTGSACCALDPSMHLPAKAQVEASAAACPVTVAAKSGERAPKAVLASAVPSAKAMQASSCCAGETVAQKTAGSCDAKPVLATAGAGAACTAPGGMQASLAMAAKCCSGDTGAKSAAATKTTSAVVEVVRAQPVAASCCGAEEVASTGAGAQAVLAAVPAAAACEECKCEGKECCSGDNCCKKTAEGGTQASASEAADACCGGVKELAKAS